MFTTTVHGSTEEHLDVDGDENGKKKRGWETTGDSVKASDDKERKIVELLHDACRKGHIDVVTSLVQDSRLNPNMQDKKGWTPLLRAAKCNQLEVMSFLVHILADVNCVTRQGNTPLHKAAKNNFLDAAHMLIEAEANINAPNEGGATPLMLTVMRKHGEEMCKLLLDSDADVNAKKDVGYSALMIAARYNHLREASVLLRAGAEIEAQDKQGETALAKAMKHQKIEMVELLKQHGATEIQRIASHPHAAHASQSRGSFNGSHNQSRPGHAHHHSRHSQSGGQHAHNRRPVH